LARGVVGAGVPYLRERREAVVRTGRGEKRREKKRKERKGKGLVPDSEEEDVAVDAKRKE